MVGLRQGGIGDDGEPGHARFGVTDITIDSTD
jgi:hypothetical protein